MTGQQVLDIFKKTGGFITNTHVVLTSGRHADSYLNKDAVYPHTKETSKLCREIASRFKDKKIQAVAAPSLGGIILSQWTAYHLSKLTRKDILAIYTEKTPDKKQIFTRGYDRLIANKSVLVVEDVTNTGASVRKVMDSVKSAKGNVVAVCVLANRDPENITSQTFGVPFYALSQVTMVSWEEKDCPLCKRGVPINTTVGKGRDYLANKRNHVDRI